MPEIALVKNQCGFSFTRLSLILLSVLLVRLGLPSGPALWLPFIALAPFALALRGCGPLAGLLLGWAGGVLFWAVSAWWLFNGFTKMLDWPVFGALCATILFCLFQGLPYGLLGLARGWMEKRGRSPGPLFSAGLLTLVVFLRPAVCPGSTVIALYSFPTAIQAADLGGVHLVHFLMLLANWLITEAVANLHRPGKALNNFVVLAVLLVAMFGYGSWRTSHFQKLAEIAPSTDFITVSSIQPNIPVNSWDGIDDSGPYAGVVGAMVKTTEHAAVEYQKADLVLWPEVPRSVACDCESFRLQGVVRAAQAMEGPVLVACAEYGYGEHKPVSKNHQAPDNLKVIMTTQKVEAKYNALWIVGEENCAPVYRKVELVPFSERTPCQELWPWLKKTVGRQLEYSPGPGPGLIALENGKRVQPLICFESGFPSLVQKGVLKGADALVNVSDDAWFASDRAAELHLGMALFRAVEQRRPLVRCTNSGAGAHIRATGEIVPGTLTPMDMRTTRQARLHCPKEMTVYSQLGDAWLWLLGAYVMVRFFWPVIRKNLQSFRSLIQVC